MERPLAHDLASDLGFSDLSLGGGFASLRIGDPDPLQPSGYTVSDRLQAMSSHFRFRKWITGNNRLTVEGEFIRGDNWREADVIYGQKPPSFRTCWFSGLFERRLRDVPGIRSLEAGLSWSSMVPESRVRLSGVRTQ